MSTEWGDETCGRPALHATTDTSGAFQFAGTSKRYKTTWFVPNLDRVAPRFHLCAETRDTLRPAYIGYGSLGETAEPDSITCIAWNWETSARVTCAGRAKRSVVTGGHWTGGSATGFYRLFLTEEPTRVRGYKVPQDRPHVYVQWVEPQAAGRLRTAAVPDRVRATVPLVFDRNKVWALQDAELWQRQGRWVASLHGFKHAFMNDMASAELIFELGAPGQTTKVAGP